MNYGRAVEMIDELAQAYPKANLSSVRMQVVKGAEEKWQHAKRTAEINFVDSQGTALSPERRRAAKANAIAGLTEVIDSFGGGDPAIERIVQEATRMRVEYTNAK